MNSTPNAKPTGSDNVLIVSADEGLVHPYRQIAPAGEQVTKATSNPKVTESGDALVADIGQAQAYEQISQANEQVTQPASNLWREAERHDRGRKIYTAKAANHHAGGTSPFR